MSVTVNVNQISVAHQGSNGTFLSFPDVCKTPPGPVPVPYPNIAQTSDLTDGTTTVKVDGSPVMTKQAKIAVSTGDEAGVALGVVSNKIKGAAQAILYSFDVKFEGQNVVRLTDPAQQNMGSGNAFGPALLQEPLVVVASSLEGCRAAQEQQQKQEKTHPAETGKCSAGWNDSGVYINHQQAFQEVADELQVTIYLRNGNWHCVEGGIQRWIPDRHQPKPHDLIKANTIKEDNLALVVNWLEDYLAKEQIKEIQGGLLNFVRSLVDKEMPPYPPSPASAIDLMGVLMSKIPGEVGKPLRAQKFKTDVNGYKYTDKWITGDYDLQDLMRNDQPGCVRVTGEDWARFKREVNKKMGWEGIQHPPQQAWEAVAGAADQAGVVHEGASFSMPEQTTAYLQQCAAQGAASVQMPTVRITPVLQDPATGKDTTRYLAVIDRNLTIVSPGKAPLVTKTDEEAANALICYGCHFPQDEK